MRNCLLASCICIFSLTAWANDKKSCSSSLEPPIIRENIATVTQVFGDLMFLMEVKNGEVYEGLVGKPRMIANYNGETFEKLGIVLGSKVLVKWDALIPKTQSIELASSIQGGPAKIARILPGDSLVFAEMGADGVGIAFKPDKIVDYKGEALFALGIREGSVVWISWNRKTLEVESVFR